VLDLENTTYPVPTHSTWNVTDSSKLTTYMDCPRWFFWNYVLGWRPMGNSVDLVCGTGWHLIQEHLLASIRDHGCYTPEAVEAGYSAFLEYYSQHFEPYEWLNLAPKDPGTVRDALDQYVAKYNALDKFEVLHIEVAGKVPIHLQTGAVYYFKMDAILRHPDGYLFIMDHKTSKVCSRQWLDRWATSFQLGGYLFATHLMYPEEELWGAIVNGVFLRKKGIGQDGLQRIPTQRSLTNIDGWLWTANEWIARLKHDFDCLATCTKDDPILYAFPQNPEACTKYRGCPYRDFCVSWDNPLRELDRGVQPGMMVEFWDPREEAKKVETVVDLTQETPKP